MGHDTTESFTGTIGFIFGASEPLQDVVLLTPQVSALALQSAELAVEFLLVVVGVHERQGGRLVFRLQRLDFTFQFGPRYLGSFRFPAQFVQLVLFAGHQLLQLPAQKQAVSSDALRGRSVTIY